MAEQRSAGGWWDWLLIALVAAGLAASFAATAERWRAELANRTVDVVFDYDGVKEMAVAEGLPVEEALRRLKEAGATGAAVSERPLADLSNSGQVEVVSGQAILDVLRLTGRLEPRWDALLRRAEPGTGGTGGPAAGLIDQAATYVAAGRGPSDRAFWDGLLARLRSVGTTIAVVPAGAPGGPIYRVAADVGPVLETGVGFDAGAIERAAKAGLGVALRPANVPGADAGTIARTFAGLPPARYTEAIFAGEEVLGYPNNLKEAARVLRERGLTFGIIEFAKQRGENALAAQAGYEAVRVHSITERELPTMAKTVAVERMLLAARERDMRTLYLRPLFPILALPAGARAGAGLPAAGQATMGAGALAYNLDYVRQVAVGLKRQGFSTGPARPFDIIGAPLGKAAGDWRKTVVLLAIMAAAVGAAGLYLLERLATAWGRRLPVVPQAVLLILATAGTVLLYLKGHTILVRQAWALGAATIFPTAAVWFTLLRPDERSKPRVGARPGAERGAGSASGLLPAFGRLWLAAVISFAGAFLVVGSLADTRFLLKVNEFAGVKLMHVIPLAVVAVLAVAVWLGEQPRPRRAGELVAEAWRYPLRLGHVVIAVVALIMLAVYILRTGNQSFLPVSDVERSVRSYLETTLAVRPRTKEFLLGHPAFILVPFLLRDRRWAAWAIALALGVIGQLSMVNTFTHIHTPLVISAWRGMNGLILGSIIGLVVAWAYDRFVSLGAGSGGGRRQAGGESQQAGEGGSGE